MKTSLRRLVFPGAYYQGRAARQDGKCRLAQPYGYMTVDGSWWLGGWHDADMEMTIEKQTCAQAA